MTAPLVSVIVSVYNGVDFLASALTCIFNQGYHPLEIIIVNDGSTDCTGYLAEEWVKKYPKQIKLIHRPNGGVAAARNTGLRAAQGAIIGILDVDDLWPDGTLHTFCDALTRLPDASVMQGYIRRVWLADAPDEPRYERDFAPYLAMNVGSMFFRRSVFDTIGLFDERPSQNEDTDFHLRVREAGLKIYILERLSLVYRMHSKNLTHGIDLKRADFFTVLHHSLERRRKCGMPVSLEGVHFLSDEQRDWPRISVVIPLLGPNSEQTSHLALHQTLKSIIAQNYPNFEVVLLSSASNDNHSVEISAAKFGLPICRVELPIWDYLEALNLGAQAASGDFLAWSHPGDTWSSHRIRIQMGYLLPGRDYESVTGLIHFVVDPTKRYSNDCLDHLGGNGLQDVLSTLIISRPAFLTSGGFMPVQGSSPLAAITGWFLRLKEDGVHVRKVPYYVVSKIIDCDRLAQNRLTTGELLYLLHGTIERKRRAG